MIPKLMIRVAELDDISLMEAIAEAAYGPYVERMGCRPAPMDADFVAHVSRHEAYVVQDKHGIGGFVVTYPKLDGQFVENVAVAAERRGTGLGRKLCNFTEIEARRRKLPKVYLYTNVKMTENLTYYKRLGYAETNRVTEDGFDRVYMEKQLTS
ncbi:MAG: GNAT family N-acetyltransferase [Rhodospirillales bacterium]|nr:GNAT family N-acetyltransferase [Rhodospirillales bacterium]